MISESFIYWFTRLDHLHSFINGLDFLCFGLCVISGIAFGITFIGKYGEQGDNLRNVWAKTNSIVKKWFICTIIAECLINATSAMLPTTKEMAAIYVIPKIANNENVQEIGSEIITLAKDWLKELHPKNVSKDAKDIATCAVTNAVNTVMTNAVNAAKSEVNKATTF